MDHDELIPIGEAARILGVSVPTLRRWEAQGKIAARRPTATDHRRFVRAEVEALSKSSAA